MANGIISKLRHPKEKTYAPIMVTIGIILWAFIALGFIFDAIEKPSECFGFVIDIIFLSLIFLLSSALYRAHAFGHFVLLSPSQFPELHATVTQQAAELGLSPTPTAFLYNSNGLVNAFARRLLGGRYVFLTSALLQIQTTPQVNFVIGHELGHHAAGHLDWRKNLLKLPAHFVPFLYPAYSRGRELTCDRVGAHLTDDLQASRSALAMLACGCGRLNTTLNCDAFEAQERMVPGFSGWLLGIFARYPRTTQRVLAVSEYFKSR